jgi:hypothetical protein
MAIDEKILSIDADDDNKDYEAFDEFLQEHTNRNKNKIASEIELMGGQYLKEIERKKKKEKLRIKKLIPYILKHGDDKYDKEELISYTYKDVEDIYNQIKKERNPFITKFFHFLFNIE